MHACLSKSEAAGEPITSFAISRVVYVSISSVFQLYVRSAFNCYFHWSKVVISFAESLSNSGLMDELFGLKGLLYLVSRLSVDIRFSCNFLNRYPVEKVRQKKIVDFDSRLF